MYTDKLGVKFLGLVPLLIPLAWFMMMYPSYVIARRILHPAAETWKTALATAALGAIAMTAWDLVMDPMMVAGQHWIWEVPGPYFGIPLLNYTGWWLTSFVVFLAFGGLRRIVPASTDSSPDLFDRQAVLSYAIVAASDIAVGLRLGLEGPALAGLFAMLPWILWGWSGARLLVGS